jgi:GNAT superfamily N-acetyltransferase
MDDIFSPGTPWELHDLEMRVIDGQPAAGFDCGRDAQNAFLYARAWRDAKAGVSVTHLLSVKGILTAYVSLLADRVALGPDEKPKGVTWRLVPALKIAQLAVDGRFAGHGLGRFMVGYVVEHARTLRGSVGCRLITLDAEPELVGWYESLGFRRNQEEQSYRQRLAAETGRDPAALPLSMRFDLREAHPSDAGRNPQAVVLVRSRTINQEP